MNTTDKLIKGSIDMHAHYGPDPFAARKVDALTGARQAHRAGMRGIVLKNHQHCTAGLASIVGQIVPEIAVIGSVCLNAEVGGLNPDDPNNAISSFHAMDRILFDDLLPGCACRYL